MNDTPWMTPFLAKHKRSPTARQDGIAAWLQNEIDYLEGIERTEHGNGALSAYRATLKEITPTETTADDGCCHKTRLKGAPCPIGRTCPYYDGQATEPNPECRKS